MANFTEDYYALKCTQCGGELKSNPHDNRQLVCTQCHTTFQARIQLEPQKKTIKPMIVKKQSLPKTLDNDIVVTCEVCEGLISIPQDFQKYGFAMIIGSKFCYSLMYGKENVSCTCPHCFTEFPRSTDFKQQAFRASDLKIKRGGHLISY